MAKQITITSDNSWVIKSVDAKTGKVSDAVEIVGSKALESKQVGQIVGATVKAAGSRRDAWLTLLSFVFRDKRLDGFKGTGDRSTGKVSKEYKAAVRDAEGSTIRAMVEAGDIKLGKGEPEQILQAFLSELREDKNYSNAKVTANRYFNLVGSNVVTESGYLIPVEVMKEQINLVVDKEPEDTSIASKLKAIVELMSKGTIDAADAIDSLHHAKQLVATLEGNVRYYAELATEQRVQPSEAQVSIPDQAAQALVNAFTKAEFASA
jgi:hypothetical protein